MSIFKNKEVEQLQLTVAQLIEVINQQTIAIEQLQQHGQREQIGFNYPGRN